MRRIILLVAFLLVLPFNSIALAEGTANDSQEDWLDEVIEEEPVKPEQESEASYFENLGPMIYKSSAITAKIAPDENRNYYIYYIMHGSPSALIVVDYETKDIVKTFALEDSKSAWSLEIDETGKLWIGGSVSSVLYSYDPNLDTFENHGKPFESHSDTAIQDMSYVDGKLYISSAYGGTLVEFDTETEEVKSFGQVKKRREFLKAVETEDDSNRLFVSVGSPMDLMVADREKGIFKSFLPLQYMSEKYAQDLVLTDRFLLARLHPSNKVLIFDKDTLKLVDEFDVSSRTITSQAPDEDAVYYTYNGQLMKYDFETMEPVELNVFLPKGTEAVTLDFVPKTIEKIEVPAEEASTGEVTEVVTELNEAIPVEQDPASGLNEEMPKELEEPELQERVVDWYLSGMVDNLGQLFQYEITEQQMDTFHFELPEQPVELYTLTSSEDGKLIYGNGYMSGGLGVYHVESGRNELYRNISQIETMFEINNKLYIGAYPSARLLVYDRTKAWDQWNPFEVIRMSQYGQERTTAVASLNKGEEIVFGTLPDASIGGGALAFYQPSTGNIDVFENFIYNQSIVSLVERQNEIFGGTSIHANQKVNQRGARLFVFNRYNPEDMKYIHLPFHSSMITSLMVDKENRLWGMADGRLFSYKDEWTPLKTKEILPAISGRFRNAQLVEGNDGFIYGSVEGKLFKADSETLEFEWIKEEGVYGLEKDYEGNLYFYDGSNLWKYIIEENRKEADRTSDLGEIEQKGVF